MTRIPKSTKSVYVFGLGDVDMFATFVVCYAVLHIQLLELAWFILQ
jgi:hypothetical protein